MWICIEQTCLVISHCYRHASMSMYVVHSNLPDWSVMPASMSSIFCSCMVLFKQLWCATYCILPLHLGTTWLKTWFLAFKHQGIVWLGGSYLRKVLGIPCIGPQQPWQSWQYQSVPCFQTNIQPEVFFSLKYIIALNFTFLAEKHWPGNLRQKHTI